MISVLRKVGDKRRKAKDITGLRFYRLIVIKRNGINKWGKSLWLCKCDCGNLCVVMIGNLTTGNNRSCGCLRRRN